METQDNQPQARPSMRRVPAAAYIREKSGAPCSAGTLAKAAVKGGGPVYRYYGKYPIYDPDDLDVYIASRMSVKVHSTAGLPPRDDAKRRGRPRALQPA